MTNRPTAKVSLPLKWHGGKHYLAKQIVAMMYPHLHYVEPYLGGGAVLFARDPDRDWFIDDAWKLKHGEKVPAGLRGCSEVVNDINGGLTNFWQVLENDVSFAKFIRKCHVTPFSSAVYQEASRRLTLLNTAVGLGDDPHIDWAWAFFIRYRQSRQGLGKDFATLSRNRTRRGMNEQVSSWLSAIEGLPEAHERLKRVAILNDDGCKVIRQQDGDKTLFYCDPPYLHRTRVTTDDYEHEMTERQHNQLLNTLSGIKGKFMLSGYDGLIYDAHAKTNGWRRVDIPIDCKASGAKEKPQRIESVWMNY